MLLSVSDLKMNLAKFELLSIGDAENVESLVSILGCMVSCIPMTYLGLRLGAPFKAEFVWDILEKIECCLAGWKWLHPHTHHMGVSFP